MSDDQHATPPPSEPPRPGDASEPPGTPRPAGQDGVDGPPADPDPPAARGAEPVPPPESPDGRPARPADRRDGAGEPPTERTSAAPEREAAAASDGETAATPDEQVVSGADAPPATGRSALAGSLWPPRVTRGQLVVAALLFALGLALAVQIRVVGEEDALRGARPEDLVRSLSDLDERTKRLDEERDELERQRTELETSSDQAEEARRQNAERELQLGVLAGTVAATGPGIGIVVDDPGAAVGADQLLDTVQELRAAGAEAMQVNEVRVVASTAFVDEEGGGVLIDGEPVERPFSFEVIGSPDDLEPALHIPGGVVQSLENEGAVVTVDRPEEVTVDALRTADEPDYAQSSS